MLLRDRIQAVLFDLDGTLIDSAPDLGAAADLMRTTRGLPPLGIDAYRAKAGAGARGMIGVAFQLGAEHPDFEPMKTEFLANYEAGMTRQTHPFDGVASMVSALANAGMPWGIVTNKAERFTLPLTRHIPVLQGASVVIGGDTTPHSKPHPAPLLEAARRLGMEPELCLYVGDDLRDVQAGKAAGMLTVAACYGYMSERADALGWGADYFVDHPTQLLNLLELA